MRISCMYAYEGVVVLIVVLNVGILAHLFLGLSHNILQFPESWVIGGHTDASGNTLEGHDESSFHVIGDA